jgi:hypothetical protein
MIALAAVIFLLAVSASWGSAGKNVPRSVAWSHGQVAFTSFDFSTLPAGGRESTTFRLTNLGRAVSGKFAVRLTGSSAFSIRASGCGGTRKQCRVTVAYAPSGARSRDHAVLTASAEHRTAARLKISGCSADASGHLYWVNDFDGTVYKGRFAAGCTPKITTLAGGEFDNVSIAVGNAHVYWTDRQKGTVNEVPVGGGSVTTLASGQDSPFSVAADGTHVYWVNYGYASDGTVNEVPVGGGSVTTLASGQSGPISVAVDGTNVYWVNHGNYSESNGTVNEVPVGGGSVTTLATSQGGYLDSLAVNGTHVYWTDPYYGTVNEVPVGGGSVTTLATDQVSPYSLAVDATHVYWISGNPGTVNEVPAGGGSVTILASGYFTTLAVDDAYVYWDDEISQAVVRVPIGGGSAKTVASNQYTYAMAVGP